MPQQPRVLFINTNRYADPPVMPIAIECLAHALGEAGIEDVHTLDLCYSGDPVGDIGASIADLKPDALCMSIRNVDTVLWPGPEYFLPEVKSCVSAARDATEAPVIIGGTALLPDPEGVLDYLGADVAVAGPGEDVLPGLLHDAANLRGCGKVVNARRRGIRLASGRKITKDSERYLKGGGIAGFRTHSGCSSSCKYCLEAATPVAFRETDEVISELKTLSEAGLSHLHLCDPEFNEDIEYCVLLLQAMRASGPDIKWALYMKPGTVTRRMMRLLKETGAYLITLSVDTYNKCPGYWADVEKTIFMATSNSIEVTVDLLAGFPGEERWETAEALDVLQRAAPAEVSVNTRLRLYRHLPVTRTIEQNPKFQEFLSGETGGKWPYLAPVYYNHLGREELNEMLSGRKGFSIAGEQRGVNYQAGLKRQDKH